MKVPLRGGGALTRRREGRGAQWVLLPGGPGMLGDAFDDLIGGWSSGGSVWTLDYCASKDVEDWKASVLDLSGRLDGMVLVGHSFGGMLLLMIDALEARLGDAVLGWAFLDSSPNRSWSDVHWPGQREAFPEAMREGERLEAEFASHPDEEGYRRFFLAYAPYYFEPSGLAAGRALLRRCRYEAAAYLSAERALAGYDARWVPEKPALVLTGEADRITPPACFADDRRFRRANVVRRTIPGAGHFPWIEDPGAVQRALAELGRSIGPRK